MGLTNPAALWLLLFVPLPLLVSRRRPRARRVVSNAYLWREALHRAGGPVAPRRRRISSQVLVQMACIGAIVLGLAGPVITLEARRTALVFDVSASMAARDGGGIARLDAARARARAIVGELPRFARVRVILAHALPRQTGEWAASDDRLLNAIDALALTAGAADVPAAIELAAAAGDVTNIVVFSDTETPAKAGSNPTPLVQWVRLGRVADNAAVTQVGVRRTELGGRGGVVLVGLRNFGVNARDADVEIATDGRIIHRRHVRLPAAGTKTLDVQLPDLGRFVTATLVGSDALSIDDSRSVAIPLSSTTRVALIGLRGSFLERALEVNPALAVRTYDEPANAPAITSAKTFDVLVCGGCNVSPDSGIPAMMVIDGSGESIRDVVRVVSRTHPLARALDPGWEHATVAASESIPPAGEIVLRVGSVPVAAAVEQNGHRSVFLHRGVTESDFVLSTAFPVLVANAVEWLAAQHDMPLDVTAGQPLAFTLPTADERQVRVLGPDGHPRALRRVGSQYIVADTGAAGLYRVEVNRSEHLVAVNPDVVAESNLSMLQTSPVDRTDNPPAFARAPTAVAKWLLLLAVALLALEWRLRVQGG